MASKTNLFKRGKIYYLRYRTNGKLICKSLGTTLLREAEGRRKELLQSVRDVKTEKDVVEKVARAKKLYTPKKFLLSNIAQAFKNHPALKRPSEQTMKAYKHWLNSFVTWINNNYPEKQYMAEITPEISQEYSKYLNSTGISPKTFNENLNILRRVFDLLRDKAGIISNPFAKDIIARLDNEPVSRKELSKEQAISVLNCFKELKTLNYRNEYELLFNMGMYTGARLKDSCLLKWEDVDLDQNLIYITPYKTRKYGTKVQIPISGWLHPKLLEAKSHYVNEYVLPNLSKIYLKNRHKINKDIKRIFEYNGLVSKKDKSTQRKLTASIYSFHSLRYCFVSFCAEAGIPMALVQDIVGHLNPAMTKHYTRFSREYKEKAISKLQIETNPTETDSIYNNIIALLKISEETTLDKVYNLLLEGQNG